MRVGLVIAAAGSIVFGSLAMAQTAGSDAELEALCRSTELAIPDSCACTITSARSAGVSDAAMRSLFADDGHSNPVGEQTYASFWNAKVECLASTTMANMGLPGGSGAMPSIAMPPSPPTGIAPPPPPVASAASEPAPAGETGLSSLRQTEVVRMTPAQARAALEQLRGTKWTGGTLGNEATVMNFREDGLLAVTYRDASGAALSSGVFVVEVDEIDPNRTRDEGRSIGYNGVRLSPTGDGVRGSGPLAQFPIKLTDLRYDFEAVERLMIDYRGGDEMVLGEYARQGYLNFTFTKAGSADAALPSDFLKSASASALHTVRVAAARGAGQTPALADRFDTVPSELLGDAQCNDDLILIPQGSAMPRTMVAMSNRAQSLKRRQIGVGYWGAANGASAYKVSFDGRERILTESGSSNGGVRRFTDGALTMVWTPAGATVGEGAFGFSPLEVTLSFEGQQASVRAVNFGGC